MKPGPKTLETLLDSPAFSALSEIEQRWIRELVSQQAPSALPRGCSTPTGRACDFPSSPIPARVILERGGVVCGNCMVRAIRAAENGIVRLFIAAAERGAPGRACRRAA